MNESKKKDLSLWIGQNKTSFWVGVFGTLGSLAMGVGFYWSKGIPLGVGGFLGLFHAAMGIGLFFGVGVFLACRKKIRKNSPL